MSASPNLAIEKAHLPAKPKDPVELKVPVRQVEVKNFLSLQDVAVELGALNVLVGPNGGGKSNFLSVFRFLGEVARTDLAPALGELFGGYQQTICRATTTDPKRGISISLKGEVTQYSSPTALDEYTLRFRLAKSSDNRPLLVRAEHLLLKRSAGRGRRITLQGAKYEFETIGRTGSKARNSDSKAGAGAGSIEEDASALSVLRRIGVRSDTKQVGELALVFEDLRLFDVNVVAARRPTGVYDERRLRPNASNLAGVLAGLQDGQPDVLAAIEDDVRVVLPGFQRFEIRRSGGEMSEVVRVDIKETGVEGGTPLSFASFGTVRAIALFTMLRDPNPPRLTCLEEVDHGLHPHALDVLVDRLREAARRSQIIVATHSPALVNRLDPEELIVFERDLQSGVTRVPKNNPKTVRDMEESSGFRLGELWYSGLLGGTPT